MYGQSGWGRGGMARIAKREGVCAFQLSSGGGSRGEGRKGRSDGLDVDGNNKNGTETATSKPGQATHNTRRRGRAAREGLRVVSLLFLLLSPTPHPSALPSALLLIPSSTSILPPRSKAGEGGRKVAITSRVAFFSFSLTTGLACKIFISRVPNGELRRILSLPPKTRGLFCTLLFSCLLRNWPPPAWALDPPSRRKSRR